MRKHLSLVSFFFLLSPTVVLACGGHVVGISDKSGKTYGGLDQFNLIEDQMVFTAGNATYRVYPKYLDDQIKGDPNNNTDNDERAQNTQVCIEVSGLCKDKTTLCLNKGGLYDEIDQAKMMKEANACSNLKDALKISSFAGGGRFNLNVRDENGKNFGDMLIDTNSMVLDERHDQEISGLTEMHLECRDYLSEDGKDKGPKKANDLQYLLCSKYLTDKKFREKTIQVWSTENNLGQFDVSFKPAGNSGDVLSIRSSTSYFEKVGGDSYKPELMPIECLSKIEKNKKICGTDVLARHHWEIGNYNKKDVHHKSEGFFDQTTVDNVTRNKVTFVQDSFSPLTRGMGGSSGLNVGVAHTDTKVNGCQTEGGQEVKTTKPQDSATKTKEQ